MFSLLTKQLKDYDIHNQINIKKNLNSSNNIENIEKNIDNKLSNNSIQCSLNSFNPTKNSPPNEWQSRLIKRINSINSINNSLYEE